MRKIFFTIQAFLLLFPSLTGLNAYCSQLSTNIPSYEIFYLSPQLKIDNNLFRQSIIELSTPNIATNTKLTRANSSLKATGLWPEQKLIQKLSAIGNPVANYDQYIKLLDLFAKIELSQTGLDALTDDCINGQTLLIKKAAIDVIIKIGKTSGPMFIKEHLFTIIKSGTLPYTIKRSMVYLAHNTEHLKRQELRALSRELAREGESTFLIDQIIKIQAENLKPLIDIKDKFTAFIDTIKTNTCSDRLNIVDLGTGDGALVRQLNRYAWAKDAVITAIDNSNDMVQAAFYLNLVEVEKMDWRKIEFPDNYFQLATINFPNPAFGFKSLLKGLKEALRVCQPGGGIAFYSVDCIDNGFDPKIIMNMLKKVGFARIQIYKASEIPSSYPVTDSSAQMNEKDRYLITAQKPGLSKNSSSRVIDLNGDRPINYRQNQIEQAI
ncbi:MAG: class I SAM-dependent methyltransferase [Candidatus Omnitrophica bacterium]|nr:class I SAM-dependent methyltransferase [Candidatus Omnitrophota bacterium]MBU1925292.1 class I SAM-dependent methyltransferase [Candidatus Omnitrophota bacterium]